MGWRRWVALRAGLQVVGVGALAGSALASGAGEAAAERASSPRHARAQSQQALLTRITLETDTDRTHPKHQETHAQPRSITFRSSLCLVNSRQPRPRLRFSSKRPCAPADRRSRQPARLLCALQYGPGRGKRERERERERDGVLGAAAAAAALARRRASRPSRRRAVPGGAARPPVGAGARRRGGWGDGHGPAACVRVRREGVL